MGTRIRGLVGQHTLMGNWCSYRQSPKPSKMPPTWIQFIRIVLKMLLPLSQLGRPIFLSSFANKTGLVFAKTSRLWLMTPTPLMTRHFLQRQLMTFRCHYSRRRRQRRLSNRFLSCRLSSERRDCRRRWPRSPPLQRSGFEPRPSRFRGPPPRRCQHWSPVRPSARLSCSAAAWRRERRLRPCWREVSRCRKGQRSKIFKWDYYADA